MSPPGCCFSCLTKADSSPLTTCLFDHDSAHGDLVTTNLATGLIKLANGSMSLEGQNAAQVSSGLGYRRSKTAASPRSHRQGWQRQARSAMIGAVKRPRLSLELRDPRFSLLT